MAMKDFAGVDIKVIGQEMEKYLTLSLGKYLVFKDSLQFLGSSLATLAKNLEKTGFESFIRLRKKFHGFQASDMRLLVRKGEYPYEYMDSLRKWMSNISHTRRRSTPSLSTRTSLTRTTNMPSVFDNFNLATMKA